MENGIRKPTDCKHMRRHFAQRLSIVLADGGVRVQIAHLLVGIDGDQDVGHIGLYTQRNIITGLF